MVDQARLNACQKAGKRRDYDFNNREHYKTKEEAQAFDDGLKESMKQQPIVESLFQIVKIEYVDLKSLRERMQDPESCLMECQECNAIADRDDCLPGEGFFGNPTCPICSSPNMKAVNEEHLDNQMPWRACDKCNHEFLMDDALGGGEPGSYICPKCRHTTI